MAKKPLPSPEVLRQLLRYEPETGKLFWKERGVEWFKTPRDCKIWNSNWAFSEALTAINSNGYAIGSVLGGRCRAHRVAWAIATGEWPENDIDHINGIRSDNRLKNLRSVTRSENGRNRAKSGRNTSGTLGVYWSDYYGKWVAKISDGTKNVFLGAFEQIEDAENSRKMAEKVLGYHKNHGR